MAIKILGHRGIGRTLGTPFNQDKPSEHSLESFKQARDAGADGIEFDVFLTKDKQLVIYGQNTLYGTPIEELTLEQIAQKPLPDGQKVPSLREALDLFKAFPDDFLYNVELKGQSIVEPTINTIADYVSAGALDWGQFLFSSFDWDKLSLVKDMVSQAKIQPTTATKFIFENDDIQMPGYFVSLTKTYNQAAMQGLSAYIQKNACHAIDVPTMDIRPEFLDVAAKSGAGFCTHPTGPRRKEDLQRLTGIFSMLDRFAKKTGLPVYLKVDDVKLARDILNKKNKSPSVSQLSRLTGVPALRV